MNDIPEGRSVTVDMARRFGMEPRNFEQVLRATVVPANCSPEQFAAFLLVAKQYSLNPITREIYAFPARGGGIQPIVGIDGWMRILNDHPQMNGLEFRDRFGDDKGVPDAITCLIYRKDREHPTVVTEYLKECWRDTDPWKKWPARMLRHKAAIQAARYAFGFSGIIDPDEYERGVGAGMTKPDITPPPPPRGVRGRDYGVSEIDSGPVGTDPGEGVEHREPTEAEVAPRVSPPAPDVKTQLQRSLQLTEEEKAVIDDEIPDWVEDPDKYLDDLDREMNVCKEPDELAAVWAEHEAQQNRLMEPDRDKAEFIRERHSERIRATKAVEEKGVGGKRKK